MQYVSDDFSIEAEYVLEFQSHNTSFVYIPDLAAETGNGGLHWV